MLDRALLLTAVLPLAVHDPVLVQFMVKQPAALPLPASTIHMGSAMEGKRSIADEALLTS
ncbi:MAG: hypothetical protein KDC00_09570 [Flavobacteriales bacterium]|nr:hypothetical protein [Flavobacteriales bacterium]